MSDRRSLGNHRSRFSPNEPTAYAAAVAQHGPGLEQILAPHVRRHPQASSDACALIAHAAPAPDDLERAAADAAWADREDASYADLFDRLTARGAV